MLNRGQQTTPLSGNEEGRRTNQTVQDYQTMVQYHRSNRQRSQEEVGQNGARISIEEKRRDDYSQEWLHQTGEQLKYTTQQMSEHTDPFHTIRSLHR